VRDLLILGMGKVPPSQLTPKGEKLVSGGVGGGDFSLLH